mgnify:CR=1 FL=1
MFTLKQDLGCPRRMTVYAIFDILDRLKSSYDQVMTGDIQAQVSVFGKECLCALQLRKALWIPQFSTSLSCSRFPT